MKTQKYVLVQAPDGLATDEKASAGAMEPKEAAAAAPRLTIPMRITAKLRGMKKGNKGGTFLSCKLWAGYSSTSSAGTALANVGTLTPASGSDVTTYLSLLFDEMRITGMTLHTRVSSTVNTSSDTKADWAVAYDPTDNTAPINVVSTLDADDHLGPMGPAGMPGAVTGPPTTKTGFHIWNVKTDTGEVFGTTVYGGNWFETKSNTAAVVGYLKSYVEAGGATEVFRLDMYICYHCQFRRRS